MRHSSSRERALLKIASDSTFRGMVDTIAELGADRGRAASAAHHGQIAQVLELAQTAERGRICDVLLVGHRASRWRPGRRKLIRMLYEAIAEQGDPTFAEYSEHQPPAVEHQDPGIGAQTTPLSERLEGGPIPHPIDPPGFELKTAPPRGDFSHRGMPADRNAVVHDDRDESQVGMSLGG